APRRPAPGARAPAAGVGAAAAGAGHPGAARPRRRAGAAPVRHGRSARLSNRLRRHRAGAEAAVSAAFRLRPEQPAVWRRRAALGLMGLFALAVLGRAFWLQVMENDFLTKQGNARSVRNLVLQANRGAVRDRNGNPLALSAPVDSI